MKPCWGVVAAVVVAVSVEAAPPACELFQHFPGEFDQEAADLDAFTVVTLADSRDFSKLLLLDVKYGPEMASNDQRDVRQLRMRWCEYVGFNAEFHYAYSKVAPREIYRIKRSLIDDASVVRSLERRVVLDIAADRANADLPSMALPAESFVTPSVIGPLDRSLAERAGYKDVVEVPDHASSGTVLGGLKKSETIGQDAPKVP